MLVYNYTEIRRREKRIYSFFNMTVSKTGILFSSLISTSMLTLLFSIPGLIFCFLTKKFWYNPINLLVDTKAGYFYLAFVFTPISFGILLNSLKIQNYKLIDYLKIYFLPKYTLDKNGKKLKIHGYKIDSLIERI